MKKAMTIVTAGLPGLCLAARGQSAETQSTQASAPAAETVQESTQAAETAAAEETAGTEEAAEETTAAAESAAEETTAAEETAAAEKTSASEGSAAAETQESAAQTEEATEGYADNFAVDSEAAAAFAAKIQEAVAAQDLEALADLTAYPVYVGFPEESATPASREEFVALGADRIFTPELMEAVAGADLSGLSASMAGFVVSADDLPSIIFGVVDGALAIKGINY